jgi:hypothetical protein
MTSANYPLFQRIRRALAALTERRVRTSELTSALGTIEGMRRQGDAERSAVEDRRHRSLDQRFERVETTLAALETGLARVEPATAAAAAASVATQSSCARIESALAHLSNQGETLDFLVRTIEQRSRVIEELGRGLEMRSKTIEELSRTIEARTNTLEFVARQSLYMGLHQIDHLQKSYTEFSPALRGLSGRKIAPPGLELQTDHPIALGSNDHLSPDSTTEGIPRPTMFVQDCIRVLGEGLRLLDLGLVYEARDNGVLAMGIDGSDFCRRNRIGYWPLLDDHLFTCDITKPFQFVETGSATPVRFDLVTMWEVLEHIDEKDLPALFSNIHRQLTDDGYFLGSISLLEYLDTTGKPYHVTLQDRDWWKSMFLASGIEMLDVHPFNEYLFCRGNGPRYQDFHNYKSNPQDGFLFVARKSRD